MRNRKVTVTGANILFFIFAISFLTYNLIIGFVDAMVGGRLIKDNMYLMLFINEYIFILLPVIIYSVAKRLDFKEVFRFRRLELAPAAIIVVASLPAYFTAAMLNTIVVYMLQFIGDVPTQIIPVPQNIGELMLGLVLIAFSPALCEEMLNRGIMLKGYENRGSMKAIVITAIFFGLFHFDITNLLGPIFLGLIIGYYTVRTNSIFAAMLAHFMNNAIAEVFSFIFRDQVVVESTVKISLGELGSTIFYGIAGLIILRVLLKFFKRVTSKSAVINPPISNIRGDIISIISHWPVTITLILYALLAVIYLFSIVAAKYFV